MSGSEDVRPREKLLACDNPKAIATEDLLAIVLGHGTKGKNVFDLTLTPHHLGNMFNPSLSSKSLTFFGTSEIMLCSPRST